MTTTTCPCCGSEFTPKRSTETFCSTKCRKDFNNLRATRGAILYDAVMSWRFDRKNGEMSESEMRKLVVDLAREWRNEDYRVRNGRRSWNLITGWIAKNPWIKSLRFDNVAGIR